MNITLRTALIALLVAFGAALPAQPKSDEKARELVSLGKKQYFNNNWKDAANSFELATQRPTHDLSTFAWYMAGMSYYNSGSMDKAEACFKSLAKEYPESKYLEEAKYHRGLILLDGSHTMQREDGQRLMLDILEKSSNPNLKSAAEGALKQRLFYRYELRDLSLYKVFAPNFAQVWYSEAIAYQLDKRGEGPKALEEIKKAEAAGINSPYLSALKARLSAGRVVSASRLNIAVCLGFNADRADTASVVPAKSLAAVEMLEGMMMALDSIGPGIRKEINIKVFDTRGDTARTARILLDSLAAFNPDIVVGDVRTGVAGIISNWAEKRKVIHIIPRNPLNDLISGKKYTFLAHPSLSTHGRVLAEYLVKNQGKRSVAVFNDKTYYSEKLARAFADGAKAAGASVTEKPISKEPAKVRSEASIEAKNIKTAGTEVVYVPLSNEESAGMIMSYLNYHSAKPVVAGGPDWEAFNVIDSELKTSFQLKYTTLFHDKNDSIAAMGLRERCADRYDYEPTMNTIMGYDIMAWVLHFGRDLSNHSDPAQAIHKATAYHGIHQDFYFGDAQDNQKVNIVQFTKGRVDKVNHD